VFDMSGSMSDKVDKARQAAVQFFKTANPLDEFFMVSFNDRAELTSRFTSSVEELENRMMFTEAHGRTALLDAIYLGLSEMRVHATPNEPCSSYRMGGIIIAGTTRTTLRTS